MNPYTTFKQGQVEAEALRQLLIADPAVQPAFDYMETAETMLEGMAGSIIGVYFKSNPSQQVIDAAAAVIAAYEYQGVESDVRLPEYADSAAALAGGLQVGQMFRTGEQVKHVI